MNTQELQSELVHFTGSETIYRHALNARVNYTEGVRFFARNAGGGAYWLLDILATQPEILNGVKEHSFCIAMLKVEDSKAVLTVARDYSENTGFQDVVYRREIEYTDCPPGEWKFYFTGNTILLPREY